MNEIIKRIKVYSMYKKVSFTSIIEKILIAYYEVNKEEIDYYYQKYDDITNEK